MVARALPGDPADGRYAAVADRAASQIAALLERALRVGAVSAGELFGEADDGPLAECALGGFRDLEDRRAAIAERLFPQVQDRVVARDDRVLRCVAADRFGRVPVANACALRPMPLAGAAREVRSPIVVGRRRWGELRLAFRA